MKVLGLSCITNMAAGIVDRKLDHSEVMQTTAGVKDKFSSLVGEILNMLATGASQGR
jgi:purine-nucleoside phosphorylase